jgi:hypothetical protein
VNLEADTKISVIQQEPSLFFPFLEQRAQKAKFLPVYETMNCNPEVDTPYI